MVVVSDPCHNPLMPEHVLIDGNNLLHAMHAQVVGRHIGRETLVRWIERWATNRTDSVTLVFDGPSPKAALLRQFDSDRIEVRFSAPKTADDVLVQLIQAATSTSSVRLISEDTAIQYEARFRRCSVTNSAEFVETLLRNARETARDSAPGAPDRERRVSAESIDKPTDVGDRSAGKARKRRSRGA